MEFPNTALPITLRLKDLTSLHHTRSEGAHNLLMQEPGRFELVEGDPLGLLDASAFWHDSVASAVLFAAALRAANIPYARMWDMGYSYREDEGGSWLTIAPLDSGQIREAEGSLPST